MDPEEEDKKSRSQLKREYEEVKDLVSEMVALSPRQVKALPLTEETAQTILAAQTMARSPLKRQLRHIASRMSEEDIDAIRAAIIGAPHEESEDAPIRESERWGDKLIAGDDELLSQFIEEHPAFDRQQLRQLVRKARKERRGKKPPTAAGQLFEFLKSLNA